MALISRACVRGRSRATRSASRPTRSSRLGGASPISFSTVLFREFFFESSFWRFPGDVGQQSDPQSDRPAGAPPAGRRRHFLNSGWGLVRPPRRRICWCGRRRRASAARYGVDFDTTPIEAALNWRGVGRTGFTNLDGAAVDLTIVRPAAAAPPRRLEQVGPIAGPL